MPGPTYHGRTHAFVLDEDTGFIVGVGTDPIAFPEIAIGGVTGDAYEDVVLDEASLLAYYPCNDASGGAVDVVNGYNLSTVDGDSVFQVPGPFAGSYAIESRGNTGYLESTTPVGGLDAAFTGTNDFTIEGWFKLIDPQDAQGVFMFGYKSSGGTAIDSNIVGIAARATATYAYRTSVVFAFPAIPRLPVNAWGHVAYTYDGADMKVYVGGVLAVTQATSGGITAGDVAIMGSCTVQDYNHFHGIAIYTSALSQATIAQHALAGELASPGAARVIPVTGTYTIPPEYNDTLILADGTFTVTLPSAVLTSGLRHTIKRTGSGTITVSAAGTQQIDGAGSPGTYSLNATSKAVTVVSDGLGWRIVAAYL